MLRLAWSRGAWLPECLKRRCRAFSLSSHWAAALLWDLWISCRWLCVGNNRARATVSLPSALSNANAQFPWRSLTSSAGVGLCTDRSLTVLWNRERRLSGLICCSGVAHLASLLYIGKALWQITGMFTANQSGLSFSGLSLNKLLKRVWSHGEAVSTHHPIFFGSCCPLGANRPFPFGVLLCWPPQSHKRHLHTQHDDIRYNLAGKTGLFSLYVYVTLLIFKLRSTRRKKLTASEQHLEFIDTAAALVLC